MGQGADNPTRDDSDQDQRAPPQPSREALVALLKENQDSLAKLAEKREDRMIKALVGAGGLIVSFFALWATSSSMQEDLVRTVAFAALFGMTAELLLTAIVPSMIREAPAVPLRRVTLKRMLVDASRRSLTFRLLYLLAILLLLPMFYNWAGLVLVSLIAFNLAADIGTFFMKEERLLGFQRAMTSNLATNPKRNVLILGILPPILFAWSTWPFLIAGRAVLAVQLALPLVGIMLLAFYSTFAWAFLRSAAEAQRRLSELRTGLLMGTASVEETLARLRAESTADAVVVFDQDRPAGK